MLLLPRHGQLEETENAIFAELSHLIANQRMYLQQSFMLVYYLYLLLVHREIRRAPQGELFRLKEMIAKHQLEILKNYAESKKQSLSRSEQFIKSVISQHHASLGIEAVKDEEEDLRVLEVGEMNFLLMPTSRVRQMVEAQQSLKDFTLKCMLIPYTLDILAGDLAFEVNGPHHYFRDTKTGKYHLNGQSKLKREFIDCMGLRYIEVPFWEVDRVFSRRPEEQAAAMKALIDGQRDEK